MPKRHVARREFVATAAASLAIIGAGRGFAQSSLADPPAANGQTLTEPDASTDAVIQLARDELDRLGPRIRRSATVAIADFSRPSWAPRLFLVDMVSGEIHSLLVAHGSGSDPDQTGQLEVFSNTVGSLATSEGAFQLLGYYYGIHGRSLKIAGLDPTNSNALKRDIVIHSADYVSPVIIQNTGKLGWSEGCFAVAQADLAMVLARLGPGHLLISTRLDAPIPEGATPIAP